MQPNLVLEIARIAIGLLGAYFLFREVYLSHKVEGLKARKAEITDYLNSDDIKELNRMTEASKGSHQFNVNQKRELLSLYFGFSIKMEKEQTKELFEGIPDERVEEMYLMYEPVFKSLFSSNAENIQRLSTLLPVLEKLTAEGKMKSRRFSLSLGFGLVVISYAIDLWLKLCVG